MTKTGDAINEQTQKAAQKIIGEAYLARCRKAREVMADLAAGCLWEKVPETASREDCYDVFEVLDMDLPLAGDEVPALPVLVALGRDNLKGLLGSQYKLFGKLVDEQKNFNVIRGGLAQNSYVNQVTDRAEDELFCTAEDDRWKDLLGTACEACPKRAQYYANCERAAMYRGPESQRKRFMTQAEQSDPTGKPCFVFQEGSKNDELRHQFLVKLRSACVKLEEDRKNVTRCVENILKAKNDPNLQADLPLFPCFRTERYLVDGEIFCYYIHGMEQRGVRDGFLWYKVVNDEQHPLPNFVTQDESGAKLVKTFTELKREYSAILFDPSQIYRAPLGAIDVASSLILKPWEIMTLRKNPEYAKMWVYSNFIGPGRSEVEADKYLKILLGR